jgi:hypothetical protein
MKTKTPKKSIATVGPSSSQIQARRIKAFVDELTPFYQLNPDQQLKWSEFAMFVFMNTP